MNSYNKDDENRSYVQVEELLKERGALEEAAPALTHGQLLGVLERLRPGVSPLILDTLAGDEALSRRLEAGETDLVEIFLAMEDVSRPPVPPTARSANVTAAPAFNAHNLTDEEFARISRIAHSGQNVRV